MAYYAQWKVSNDKLGGNLPEPLSEIELEKHGVYALGPDVTVPIVRNEKLIALISARYQWEFEAQSNLQGQMFNLIVSFPFFAGS